VTAERDTTSQADGATGEVDVPGTRSDLGVGSSDRDAGWGPKGATGSEPAGSRSEAAEDTSVEVDGPTERSETREPIG